MYSVFPSFFSHSKRNLPNPATKIPLAHFTTSSVTSACLPSRISLTSKHTQPQAMEISLKKNVFSHFSRFFSLTESPQTSEKPPLCGCRILPPLAHLWLALPETPQKNIFLPPTTQSTTFSSSSWIRSSLTACSLSRISLYRCLSDWFINSTTWILQQPTRNRHVALAASRIAPPGKKELQRTSPKWGL